jgi:hypothetical protein
MDKLKYKLLIVIIFLVSIILFLNIFLEDKHQLIVYSSENVSTIAGDMNNGRL